MMDTVSLFLLSSAVLFLIVRLALWYARRLRSHAQVYDPLWYVQAAKSTPLGYYSARRGRRIARRWTRMEPRG